MRLPYHPYDAAWSVRGWSLFCHMQESLDQIPSDGSCHCDGDHLEVESEGSWSGFPTNRSVELGSPFHEGTPVIWRIKLDRRLMPLLKSR